jgi:hypothetical protein
MFSFIFQKVHIFVYQILISIKFNKQALILTIAYFIHNQKAIVLSNLIFRTIFLDDFQINLSFHQVDKLIC